MSASSSALVAGATGLVGGYLLKELLDDPDYSRVIVLSRRPLPGIHPKLQVEIADFDRLQALPTTDHAYCSLGTTIAKAGSQRAFATVDHDYVVAFAQRAAESGASRFVMVSALGADPNSRIFYSRVKGEAERDVAAVGINCWFLRPSLIDGPRQESRPAERMGLIAARTLSPLMAGPLRKYRVIHALQIAQAMVRVAKTGQPPPGVIESDEIARLATRT